MASKEKFEFKKRKVKMKRKVKRREVIKSTDRGFRTNGG